MKKSTQTRPIQALMPLTLRQLVMTVSEFSRNDLETAHVINDLLLTRRVWFLEPMDPEEIRLMHS